MLLYVKASSMCIRLNQSPDNRRLRENVTFDPLRFIEIENLKYTDLKVIDVISH